MNNNQIIKAIYYGLNSGHEDYFQMASESIFDGPEYFMTISIARAIKEKLGNQKGYVTLEYPIDNIIEKNDHKKLIRARLLKSKKKGPKKVDILLWGKDGKYGYPRVVVEVKSHVDYGSIDGSPIARDNKRRGTDLRHDVCRISKMLSVDENGSLKLGVIAFYGCWETKTNVTATEEKLRTKIELLDEKIRKDHWNECVSNLYPQKLAYKHETREDYSYLWTSGCIILKRNR